MQRTRNVTNRFVLLLKSQAAEYVKEKMESPLDGMNRKSKEENKPPV